MSSAPNLELSDEQRENVRKMLAKFSSSKKKKRDQKEVAKQDQVVLDPDPLESSPPGSTIEWHELTPKTRRYSFVRETRSWFVPLILDKTQITLEYLNFMIGDIGMDITSQNNSLTICAAVQADPVRIFQVQTVQTGEKLIIETIRYIV